MNTANTLSTGAPALDCEIVRTRSGAPAVRDRLTGELMHPVVGPLVEAEQLYVTPSRLEARLRAHAPTPLVLLDVGLGAGSNAIRAWQLSERLSASDRLLEILSFDRSLAALELALAPEHCAAFGFVDAAGVAGRALSTHGRHSTARTEWRLHEGDLFTKLAQLPESSADVVFWDPFSPRKNAELWTVAAFSALFRVCRPGATVHTYSGATSVRSALLLAGFAVGVGHEVGELKENTGAAVNVEDLAQPLDLRWLARLERSSCPFPADAPSDALTRIAALTQFRSGAGRA